MYEGRFGMRTKAVKPTANSPTIAPREKVSRSCGESRPRRRRHQPQQATFLREDQRQGRPDVVTRLMPNELLSMPPKPTSAIWL